LIVDYGSMDDLPKRSLTRQWTYLKDNIAVLERDSHTHIVYAGNREQEFVDRINGLSYEEIANRGGGISNRQKLNDTTEEEIYNQSKERLEEIMRMWERLRSKLNRLWINNRGELKMPRVIKRLSQNYPVTIKQPSVLMLSIRIQRRPS
jgi:imidazolonepropionase